MDAPALKAWAIVIHISPRAYDMPDSFLDLLSASRTRIVLFVKGQGDVSVDEASEALGLAGTTIRQHFDHLEKNGLIEYESVSTGPGRPTSRYRLTPRGGRLFPSQDGQLLGVVLDFMLDQGYPGLVNDFFMHTWARRKERLIELLNDPPPSGDAPNLEVSPDDQPDTEMDQKLRVIAQFLSDEGFMSRLEVDGGCVSMKHHNCPFSEAVRATKLPCRLEAELFEQLLDRKLTRTSYMPDGDAACTYEFELDPDDDAPT